jgi:integrase
MTAVRLKHISRFRDRHGHLRHYLRLPGRKPVALPGQPGSPEFMAAYNAAVAAATPAEPKKAPEPAPGTFDALAVAYYTCAKFTNLRPSTQAAYRRIVEEVRRKHGNKPVGLLDAEGVRLLMGEKSEHVTAANHRLRLLRALMARAVELKWIAADPTMGVRRLHYKTDGYPTWSEEEIKVYETKWKSGTRERLAFALLLYTGQRRSDVVRMGRQHLTEILLPDGTRRPGIRVRQVKTGRELTIPLHAELAAELEHVPQDQLTFLLTSFGKPFSPRGFYNLFREWCDKAGIPPGRSPHGLRKGCGRRLAEAGASAHQIMSILGVSLKVAEIYTRAAEQARLAVGGMDRIANTISNPNPPELPTLQKTGG